MQNGITSISDVVKTVIEKVATTASEKADNISDITYTAGDTIGDISK